MVREEVVSPSANREVLGAILQNSGLLKTYSVETKDFVHPVQKIIVSAIESLAENGDGGAIHPCVVTDYLKEYYPSKHIQYVKAQGEEFLRNLVYFGEPSTFHSHWVEMKKCTILRELFESGIDITEFYDADEIDSEINEMKRKKLEAHTPASLMKHFEDKYKTTLLEVKMSNSKCMFDGLEVYTPDALPDAKIIKTPLIEGMMLDRTMNSIVGQSKAGKSFFSYQLAFCVQNGIDFLGHKTYQRDVLVVDFELREDAISERYENVKSFYNLENPQPYKIIPLAKTWGNPSITLDNITDKVRMIKEQNPNLGLVIFDCYYRFAEGEENRAEDTMRTLSKLKLLTKDMAVVYVHHTNKTGSKFGSDAINSGSGSGVHGRIVDQTYNLTAKNDGTVLVVNTGRDWYNINLPCRRDDTGYFILDDAEKQAEDERIGIKKKITKEEIKEKNPDICNFIEENSTDGYGVTLAKIRREFPNEDVASLKEKGFISTGNNKREDGVPSGRILLPD